MKVSPQITPTALKSEASQETASTAATGKVVSLEGEQRSESKVTAATIKQASAPMNSPEQAIRKSASKASKETANINFTSAIVAFFTVVAIAVGFEIRNEYYLTPTDGFGYALGIAGGVMMLLLLLYPLHKRYQLMGRLLTVQRWFQIHMLLGIVGPVCILYHCNFSFGSINSNVALLSMILMVLSGLVGRFIYTKIHFGLYGQKTTLVALKERQLFASKQLTLYDDNGALELNPKIRASLSRYEQAAAPRKTVLGNFSRIVTMGVKTRARYLYLCHLLDRDKRRLLRSEKIPARQIKQEIRELKTNLREYMSTIRKIAQLYFYERLFSFWHMFHLPIFFMLVVTGFVHVYAVHVY